MAGITTFFAMAYVLFVIPENLSEAGMRWDAIYSQLRIVGFVDAQLNQW